MNTSREIKKTVVVDLAAHNLEKQADSFVAQMEIVDPTYAARQQAFKNFKKLGLPNIRHEDWKYTDLHSLVSQKFHLQTTQHKTVLQSEQKSQIQCYIDNILCGYKQQNADDSKEPSKDKNILVVVDGSCDLELSVFCGGFSEKRSDCANYIGSLKDFVTVVSSNADKLELEKVLNLNLVDHAIYNLINATWLDGVMINLKDSHSKHNIHILHVDSGNNSSYMVNNKHVCLLQPNVCLELTQEHLSLAIGKPVNHNISFDICLQNNSKCNHYILQDYQSDSFHLATYLVEQGKNSEYRNYNFNFGGKLSRQDIIVKHVEDYAETALYGLALPHQTQHMDSHLKIYHNSSHGKSFQDYRYVLADRGHGVFNGMVYVAEDTVANHAEQSNKNILLSTHAQIDTKPELQIYSDDVTCRHGATIGKLDQLSLFYLQARGIDKESAKKLLVLAFIQHIGDLVNNAKIASWLDIKLNSLIDKI